MEERKARLAALAAKAGRNSKEAPASVEEEESNKKEQEVTLKFRNYTPSNLEQDSVVLEPETKRAKTEEPSALELALEKARSASTSHEETTKKINWDLKRDIQPKLDKLQKRTQKAIVGILRERLEREAAEDVD